MSSEQMCFRCLTLPRSGGKGACYCAACLIELQAESHAKDPRYVLVSAAKNVPCVDCGVSYPPAAMDLDHVRGTKLFALNRVSIKSMTLQQVQAELEKCEVRCAVHHRLRHAGLPLDPDPRDRNAIAEWERVRAGRQARRAA